MLAAILFSDLQKSQLCQPHILAIWTLLFPLKLVHKFLTFGTTLKIKGSQHFPGMHDNLLQICYCKKQIFNSPLTKSLSQVIEACRYIVSTLLGYTLL